MALNTSVETTKMTLFPQEESTEHKKHHRNYRCEHAKSDRTNHRSHSPRIVLPDQHIRDLSDVYRRDKGFTRENRTRHHIHHTVTPCLTTIEKTPISSEQFFYVPCDCHSSPLKRFCQNLVNGFKGTIEFGLLVATTIAHRDQLVSKSYPFDQRTTFNTEMQEFNRLRDQYRQKSAPMKHTTIETYYSLH